MSNAARMPELFIQPATGASAIRDALSALGRHWLVFTLVATSVSAAASAVILHLSPVYTSVATISVRPEQADPLASMNSTSAKLDDGAVETQVDALKSREIARAVVEALAIGKTRPTPSWPVQVLCDAVPRISFCTRPVTVPTLGERVDDFLRQLTVLSNGRSQVVSVGYTSSDPTQAAAAANMVVTLAQQRQVTHRAENLRRTTEWLDNRAHDLNTRLGAAEAAAGAFRAKSGLNENAVGATSSPLIASQIASAAADYSQAQGQLAAAEARAGAVGSARGTTQRAIRLTEEPVVVVASTALNALYSQRALLAQNYGDRYPPLVAINSQISQAEAKLAAETGRAVGSINEDLAIRREQVARLGRNLADLRAQGNATTGPLVQLKALDREAASVGTIYQTFFARAREIADRSGILQPSIEFVSHADVPDFPSFPQTNRLLMGAALFGLISGAGAAFGRSFLSLDTTVSDKASQQLGLPLLASVPALTLSKRLFRSLPRYVERNPFSPIAESIRSLVAQLTLAGYGQNGLLGSVVTSATAEEGKSTICVWLAEAVAKTGQRSLLIDGDHRKGNLHRTLGKVARPGLTEWVRGEAQLTDVIQTDEINGMDFIAAGGPLSRPFSQPELARLQAMLDRVKQQYGAVVVDTPPLLAMADALLYARLVDHTVLVCRWDHTGRAAVQACLDRLRAAGARMAGVVMSMVDPAARYGEGATKRDVKLLERYYGG